MQYQFLIDALYFPSHPFLLVSVIRVFVHCEPKKSFRTLFSMLVFKRKHWTQMFRKWIEKCKNWTHRLEWIESMREGGEKTKKRAWEETVQRNEEYVELNECMNKWERKKLNWEWKNNINNRNCLIEKFCEWMKDMKMRRNQCNDFWALLINPSCHAAQIYRHKLPISSGSIIFITFEWVFWDFAVRTTTMTWYFLLGIFCSSLNIYYTHTYKEVL